jgi:hypothetical protein
LELVRKWVEKNELTNRQYSQLADVCLERQKRAATRRAVKQTAWLNLLQGLYSRDHLSDAQQKRYFVETVTNVRLNVRPLMRQGGPLPVKLTFEMTTGFWGLSDYSSSRIRSSVSNERVKLRGIGSDVARDYFPVSSWPIRSEEHPEWTGEGESKFFLCRDVDVPIGKYSLVYTATIELLTENLGRVVWSQDVEFTREVRIDYSDAGDIARTSPSPQDATTLRRLLNIRGGAWLIVSDQSLTKISRFNPDRILEVTLNGIVPFSFAFDVEIVTKDMTQPVGWIAARAGDTKLHTSFREAEHALYPIKGSNLIHCDVMIRLKPSEEAARQTADITEIWDERLLIGPIQLELPATPAILPPL